MTDEQKILKVETTACKVFGEMGGKFVGIVAGYEPLARMLRVSGQTADPAVLEFLKNDLLNGEAAEWVNYEYVAETLRFKFTAKLLASIFEEELPF